MNGRRLSTSTGKKKSPSKRTNDEFKLKGLEALTDLNGYNFSGLKKLPSDYQTRIEDKKLKGVLLFEDKHLKNKKSRE